MTPEELADLLNEDIDSVTTDFLQTNCYSAQEEVEYIVEAVDEGLVVSLQVIFLLQQCWWIKPQTSDQHSIQEKQALFYPDLDYSEESSEEVPAETERLKAKGDEEEEMEEEEIGEEEMEEVVENLEGEEDELVEYDYTLLETSGTIVVLDSPLQLDYIVDVEETRSEMEEVVVQPELGEPVKYEHFDGDRKIFEIVIMSGM